MGKNSKITISIVCFAIVLLLLVGVTVAFFNYTRTGSSNTIKVGRIFFNTNQNSTINLSNIFPIDSGNIDTDTDNVGTVSIQINGDTTYSEGIEYLVSVTNISNTINNKRIPISIAITPSNLGNNSNNYWDDRGGITSIYNVLSDNVITDNQNVVVGYITNGETGIHGTISIKAYLDKARVAITDTYDGSETETNGTTTNWINERVYLTTNEWNSLQSSGISFKVKVEANEGIWVEKSQLTAYETVQLALDNMATPPIYRDTKDTESEEDDTIYLVGNNNTVNFNYVYYSGKLWRIVSLNSDNTLKLITEDTIASIMPGSNDFSVSFVKQWLNEDFYATLANANDIVVQNSTWNSDDGTATTSDSTPKRPRNNTSPSTITTHPVGLLDAFEYYNVYNNSSSMDNYLLTGYDWLTLTKTDVNKVRYVFRDGTTKIFGGGNPSQESYGIRPVINLASNVIFTGEGTKASPYKIVGDIDSPTNNVTLLNSRISGEYVNFDDKLFRIVGVDDNKTKLVMVDYVRNPESTTTPKDVLTKHIGSTNIYGKSTNTQSDDYWDYYLNNTWYNSISDTYKNMMVDGTYYLGKYGYSVNYKITICKDDNLNSVTTSNCTKYTNMDEDSTFTGKVGLLRVGEMFSSQEKTTNSSVAYYLITPNSIDSITKILSASVIDLTSINMNLVTVRPTIYLNSNVIITSGLGTNDSPYEITM